MEDGRDAERRATGEETTEENVSNTFAERVSAIFPYDVKVTKRNVKFWLEILDEGVASRLFESDRDHRVKCDVLGELVR